MANCLRVDELFVVGPAELGKDGDGLDVRAFGGQGAPHVTRLALQPFTCEPSEIVDYGVTRDFGPEPEQGECCDGNTA